MNEVNDHLFQHWLMLDIGVYQFTAAKHDLQMMERFGLVDQVYGDNWLHQWLCNAFRTVADDIDTVSVLRKLSHGKIWTVATKI